MKLGNFVLRCAFLQIFIVFALYSYAQSTNEDVHKYKMIEAINSGNFEEAAKEIVNVKDWMFEDDNEKSYLDLDSAFNFINHTEFSNLLKPDVDSLYLYVVEEMYVYAYYFIEKEDFVNAINLLENIIQNNKRVLGVRNNNYFKSLNELAYLYYDLGKFNDAKKIFENALIIAKEIFGSRHLEYAVCLNNLSAIYLKEHNYEKAKLLCISALRIRKEVLGEEHLHYLLSLSNLALIYSYLNNYFEAEKLYKEALEIRKKVLGKEHPDYASNLNALANIYKNIGNYVQAELLCKEVLEIRKKVLGEGHPDYASSLNDLANIYKNIGNYVQAELLYKEALEIRKKVLGEEHPDCAVILNNLAGVYKKMGKYQQVELFYNEALDITSKTLAFDNYQNIVLLNNLALFYIDIKNYKQAKKIYRKIIKFNGERLKIKDSNYATYLSNYAIVHYYMENYNYAQKLNKQALEIRQNILGENHLDYATSLCNQSYVYLKLQQYDKTETLFTEHSNIIKKHIKTNFEYLSEKERQLYWNTKSHHFNIYYPSFCYFYYPQKKSISEFAYNNAILTKGLLLNASMQMQNAILNSGNQMLIDQWNELCGLRQQIVFLQNKTLEEQENAGIAILEERANELDKQLTASSSEFKQGKEIWDIEWDDVKEKLKPNEVAIEFISFDYYNKGEFTDSTLYCALLLRNNSQCPEMITLFEEKELLPYISSKTEANVTNKIYDFYANGEVIKNKIWGNILPKLKEGETVYFSPSGLFHQLAIESLPYDENRKMSDVYNLVRLSSTREIVLNKNNSNQYITATLYGGIHYDTSSKELLAESNNYSQETLLASRGVENDTLDRGSVDYLPGTKKEVEKINEMLVDNNITAQLYTKNQANEESFKNLSNKHQNIIHIGTHGFTWTDSVAKKKDYFAERMQMIGEEQQYRGPIIDPLNRCGLLFAGANIALQGKSRELPEGVQDGILTAKEISLLDLRDCDLVVLSACETAKGDVTSEGVFGLQRAFKMAGVQTIIMSLWKVNDEATQMLMTEFYNNWIVKKQEKREAFKNAQNVVRKEYEEPVYWAGFIMLD